MGKIDDAEKYVPKELMQERPLSDYVYAIRIEKREVGLNEVYGYSVRNETYWLLNNYFVSSKNEKKIIDFVGVMRKSLKKIGSYFHVSRCVKGFGTQ